MLRVPSVFGRDRRGSVVGARDSSWSGAVGLPASLLDTRAATRSERHLRSRVGRHESSYFVVATAADHRHGSVGCHERESDGETSTIQITRIDDPAVVAHGQVTAAPVQRSYDERAPSTAEAVALMTAARRKRGLRPASANMLKACISSTAIDQRGGGRS